MITIPAASAGPSFCDRISRRSFVQGGVLGLTGGKIHGPGGAGEMLGVNPNTLRYRMRKLGIPFRKDLR